MPDWVGLPSRSKVTCCPAVRVILNQSPVSSTEMLPVTLLLMASIPVVAVLAL